MDPGTESSDQMLEFMIRLALRAGEIQMARRRNVLRQEWNDVHHFRTETDKEISEFVRKEIIRHYPDYNIHSEEDAERVTGHEMTFVVDEIDGTIPYFLGSTDHFGFCIALCQGTTPIIGVIFAPKREELYTGMIGLGAFCNGRFMRVNNVSNMNQVLMGIDPGKFNRTAYVPYIEAAMREDGIACFLQSGCASIPLCFVASGKYDAYLATSLEPEDMAAAVAIIRAASGKVTNLKGDDWQLGDSSILAANPVLHQKLSEFFELGKEK